MKKVLSLALAIFLTLSVIILIRVFGTNDSLPSVDIEDETNATTQTAEGISAEPNTAGGDDSDTDNLPVITMADMATGGVTAESLLNGYTTLSGVDESDITAANITSIEEMSTPVPHLKVSGTLGGSSGGSFSMHFPPKEQWEGRFYQLVHPTFVDENVSDHNIAFACNDGAYTLQTSGYPYGFLLKMGLNIDAAAAHISRTIAKNYYEYNDKIYGYIYGGSGGSMQTVGAMETTNPSLQMWDGAVPYITASPVSLGNFSIRTFARIVLESKAEQIKDAVSPGGSGDPYAGLSEMEQEVLRDVTEMGLPLQAWENYQYLLLMNNYETLEDALSNTGAVTTNSYDTNFWTQPGFLGTENSELGNLFRNLKDAGYNADGLSAAAYHRHIDPGASYYTWDHLKDSSGVPLYAQIGGQHSGVDTATMMSGGASYNGEINMKVIMIQNLMDVDSFPTDGDWYRKRVQEQGLEGSYRIWYNQYADHQENNDYHLSSPIPIPELPDRLINYVGSLEQALRDLSAWVEDDIAPPDSTSYNVVDSQIVLAENAASRKGIQPIVNFTVDGVKRVNLAAGRSVNLEARIQVPQNAGEIVSVEWDIFGGEGFTAADFEKLSDGTVVARTTVEYMQIGTYYPQVRVVSQRDGNPDTAFARVENLGRVRVVVGTE